MKYHVFDAHVDTLMKTASPKEYLEGNSRTQLDMPRAMKGFVTHLVTAICAEAEKDPRTAFSRGISMYRDVVHLSTVELFLMIEGCQPLVDLPEMNEIIKMLSVVSLTWNGQNSLGGGIGTDTGLTSRGKQLAVELDGAGVILDVSHLCDRSRRDLISLGLRTVATHCNCRAVHDFPRNLPDEDILEIAASGGVVGITFVPDFLSNNASLDTIADHLEYLVELTDISNAGFGSDFDGVQNLPAGIKDCTSWPDILELLDKRGWSTDDIASVAGNNWRRIFLNN
ncbi:MAG: dipeptidase [Candidatus Aegiribacteria sp.]|nr:dipeptidase [Candidatus Aegiribacteria sp.]